MVTGASGLIGTMLCRVAALGGATVIPVSRSGGYDLVSPQECEALPQADYIVHAAGYAQPTRFMANPFETITLNTTALTMLLTRLKPKGRLLFLSTSEVYSGSVKTFHTEDDIGTTKPSHPRAAYIESKRCGETICLAARDTKIEAIIARVSLVYGPGYRKGDTRVLNELVGQAVKDQYITLKDGGSARRTYCYISDACEMLMNILLRGINPVYNVGGEGEISIYGLARKIAEISHAQVKSPRNTAQAVEGAPSHVALDLNRYKREFGNKQFVSLDDGIAQTLEWHRSLLGYAVAA